MCTSSNHLPGDAIETALSRMNPIVGAGIARDHCWRRYVPRRHAVLVYRTLPGVAVCNAVNVVF